MKTKSVTTCRIKSDILNVVRKLSDKNGQTVQGFVEVAVKKELALYGLAPK